ncbi:hypothetical protein O181_009363 [Austropuccinia psidii MF-1]|uniref:Uncharacterized protein n=1 Tax=Austropuccinia psidii MF-1 TaxID=1389203 RepID=A0A9Q3BR79_9BASI|nr:hypothetical protein [Austropuccinia psidii MF-1]
MSSSTKKILKRPQEDDPSKKSDKKLKISSHEIVACSPVDLKILPKLDLLLRFSNQKVYHQALLIKQDNNPKLLELDQELSTPSSKSDDHSNCKKRIEDVLQWKLLRGKYRPTLPALLSQNPSEKVNEVIKKALKQLQTCQTSDQIFQSGAIKTMCELKGVGPATAAAFLSFEAPQLVPIFSDEAASFFECHLGKIKYTIPYYKKFLDCMVAYLKEINQHYLEYDLRQFERGLWSFEVLKQLAHEEWLKLMEPIKG